MSFDVQNKIALVTGANRGIGKAIVEALLQHGAAKVYAGVRNLDSAAGLVTVHGEKVVPILVDLAKPDTILAAAQTASDVQLVVSNAGVLRNATPLAADAIEALQYEIDINVFGLIRLAQAFAPVLKSNGGGAFVQLNSVASLRSFADLPELPSGYSGMYALAYIPPLWYKVMDKRVMAVPHINGDLSKVNVDPKSEARLRAKWG